MTDTGYYSLVTIGLPISSRNDEVFLEADPAVKISIYQDLIFYQYDWIRWYVDEYSQVINVMDYLNSLPNDGYAYIRVGEDSEDIDRYGNPFDFGMTVDTRILIPPNSKIKYTSGGNDTE